MRNSYIWFDVDELFYLDDEIIDAPQEVVNSFIRVGFYKVEYMPPGDEKIISEARKQFEKKFSSASASWQGQRSLDKSMWTAPDNSAKKSGGDGRDRDRDRSGRDRGRGGHDGGW